MSTRIPDRDEYIAQDRQTIDYGNSSTADSRGIGCVLLFVGILAAITLLLAFGLPVMYSYLMRDF